VAAELALYQQAMEEILRVLLEEEEELEIREPVEELVDLMPAAAVDLPQAQEALAEGEEEDLQIQEVREDLVQGEEEDFQIQEVREDLAEVMAEAQAEVGEP
jgi:hypothetical protein